MSRLFAFYRRYERQCLTAAVVCLTTSLGFGMGYIAHARSSHAPIVIELCSHAP